MSLLRVLVVMAVVCAGILAIGLIPTIFSIGLFIMVGLILRRKPESKKITVHQPPEVKKIQSLPPELPSPTPLEAPKKVTVPADVMDLLGAEQALGMMPEREFNRSWNRVVHAIGRRDLDDARDNLDGARGFAMLIALHRGSEENQKRIYNLLKVAEDTVTRVYPDETRELRMMHLHRDLMEEFDKMGMEMREAI